MLRTLLVVEDEPTIADLLALALEGAGYRVAVARDGRAALYHLAEEQYDLILSDIMMPHLDGLGLARALHADPALHAIPLILMSAVHRLPDDALLHATFLPKPFDLDRLLTTVAHALGPDHAG